MSKLSKVKLKYCRSTLNFVYLEEQENSDITKQKQQKDL